MSSGKNIHKNDVCEGCLAKERKLSPIKQYLRVYRKLMEDFLGEETLNKIITSQVPKMCSECRSLLRNAQKFQKKAKLAYETLDKINNSDDNAMTHTPSILTKFKTDSPVKEIIYDNTNADVETQNQTDDIKNECQKEIKIEFDTVVEIKDEKEFDEVKLEYSEMEYNDDLYAEDLNADVIDPHASIKEEIEKRVREMGVQKRKRTLRKKYRIIGDITDKSRNFSKMRTKVAIDEDGRQRVLDKFRKRNKYVKANFRCVTCVAMFHNKSRYESHVRKYHSPSNKYECDKCGVRVRTKGQLQCHISEHMYKYVCVLCDYECLQKAQFYYHMVYEHQRAVECVKCGLRFLYREFYEHYNNMHKGFICDYCGYRATKKQRLVTHIRVKHGENICKYCNRRYTKYHIMMRHIEMRHTKQASEECYCVECNIQFDNMMQYRNHLTTSVKHRPKKSYPCPECHKVYARVTGMKNHYKHIHLQKTSFYCEQCSRYFLNGFRLRTHIATYHNKIHPPKNKICSFCGRGFETNRILDNHIRTHTGERPFACEHCTATFAQKSALVSHARAIHKVLLRYSNNV